MRKISTTLGAATATLVLAAPALAHTDPVAHGTLTQSVAHWLTSAHHLPVVASVVLGLIVGAGLMARAQTTKVRARTRRR